MITFNGDGKLKAKVLRTTKWYEAHDKIHGPKVWTGDGGMPSGITVESDDMSKWVSVLSIPEWVPYVIDILFNNMVGPEQVSVAWDMIFAIPIGVNLDQVKSQVLIKLLRYQVGSFDVAKYQSTRESVYKIAGIAGFNTNDLIEPPICVSQLTDFVGKKSPKIFYDIKCDIIDLINGASW